MPKINHPAVDQAGDLMSPVLHGIAGLRKTVSRAVEVIRKYVEAGEFQPGDLSTLKWLIGEDQWCWGCVKEVSASLTWEIETLIREMEKARKAISESS